ncbi:MAG TPA: DUF485 domain-containing protein [Amycolatopsis sp.]|jgi:uncharacterized membrane protein (DUF485 family)|nr:DUF485 domain-containing protein [Amycolatopsis sp.]
MQNVAQTPATTSNSEETGEIPVLFGPDTPRPPRRRSGPNYVAIQQSEEFRGLRSRFRRFAFPMTGLFIVWYLAYVLLADYAHGFMSIKVFGEVNVGILLGVAQFISTALITAAYLWYAKRRLDPEVDKVKQQAGV